MAPETTLSQRGAELAAQPSLRDLFGPLFSDPYHPKTNPTGFIDIGTAENHVMLGYVAERIARSEDKLSARDFSYGEGPWGTKRLRTAMARHMNKYFNPFEPIDPEDIMFANGCTSICEELGFTICDPGDGILLSMPSYIGFQSDFKTKARVKCVMVPFHGVDQFSEQAVDKYEAALLRAQEGGTRVRALMLCHPHNPLGMSYPKATLVALMKFCNKHRIHLISDEIYALSVYEIPERDTVPFMSLLSFDYSQYIDSDLLHVLYGFSKDLAGGGLRLGCIVTKSQELMRAMSAVDLFHGSGSPSDKVACTMLEDEEWMEGFLKESRKRLANANKLARSLLDEAGIEYSGGSNAGFFIWIDLRPFLPRVEGAKDDWAREGELSKRFFAKKVHMLGGAPQFAEEAGFYRLCFAQEEPAIREGLRRVFEVLKG